ncbi:hypothetical protein INR49_005709 [Caranx melampygus]|nr:hypothetical protein INR49_005709 [Caranx melampygus]
MTADKEKRRAISREAARRRRRVESDVFGDLSQLLPLQPSVRANLDKPSVIRLTLSYIRMHTLLKGTAGTKAETSHTVKYGQVLEGGGERQERQELNEGHHEKETVAAEALEETNMYLKILEGAVIPSVRSSKSRPGVHQPLCILCVTYVLSGVEQPSLQLSLDQAVNRYLS